MDYKKFLNFINTNKLSIIEIQDILGYKNKSIINNWSKSNKVPEKALKSIKLYLELREIKEENYRLKNKIDTSLENNVNLSNIALKIAGQKSKQFGLNIEEYINSIIISNI